MECEGQTPVHGQQEDRDQVPGRAGCRVDPKGRRHDHDFRKERRLDKVHPVPCGLQTEVSF